jgi:glucose/arabinose dehydrogenase
VIDSPVLFPDPVDGAGGVLEPQAAAKSVITIQERRIDSMIVRLPRIGIPRRDSCSTEAAMQVRLYAAFLALVFAAVIAAQPIVAQSLLKSRVHATGLSSPVAFIQDPTSNSRQFVVEQGGRIRVIANGVVQATDFLDLRGAITSGGERGLLGMAVAPDYASSRRFYVNFTDLAGNTVIARFLASVSNPAVADSSSRFDLQWPSGLKYIQQPYANHNAGNLAFGPDGYLYIALGDGGSGNDPENRAQNPAELLGKVLRIDVNVPLTNLIGYVVPSTNPFVSGGPAGVLKEIWSFGLRNPWRYSFDMPSRGGTGALIIADVGQGAWEEIDYEPAGRSGRNYGWRVREGAHPNIASPAPVYNPPSGLTDPIWEYSHSVGQSITGGFVYRGSALPSSFRGRYFFADYVQGRVWSVALTINPSTGEATASGLTDHTADLGGSAVIGNISSFGLDAAGELYVVNHTGGTIVQVIASVPPSAPTNLRIIK